MQARLIPVLVCLAAVNTTVLGNQALATEARADDTLVTEVVRIGLLCGSAATGAQCVLGAEQAAAEANALGGIDGTPVELVRAAPTRPWRDFAKQTAELITLPGLVALVGPIDGVEGHLAAQIATRNRIPIVGLFSDLSLTRAFDPWIFRGAPADDLQALHLLQGSLIEPRGKRVLAVLPAERAGRQRLTALEGVCRSLGVDLIALTEGEPLPSERPDVLLLWLDAEPARRYLAAADPALLPPIVAGPFWLDDPTFLLEPPSFAGSIALPLMRSSSAPSPYRALAYDMVRRVLDAVRQVGPEPDRIRAALAEAPVAAGQSGTFSFDERGDRREELRIAIFKHGVPTSQVASPASGGRQ